MPTIAQFYGITIRMFYQDHPPPHFHAEYNEYEVIVQINPIVILEGKVPTRVRSMVLEWAALHQQELSANWNRCRSGKEPLYLDPLE